MNLAVSSRPRTWNTVVGQDRALRVLQAVLTTAKFIPRGFILEGVYGVGKTTTAYLLARSLMCTGNDPQGCKLSTGSLLDMKICPSCRTVDRDGIEAHPDFTEIACALKNGVQEARDTITTAETLPVLGKRRITMLDEAHALSMDAWKIYLTPLERKDTNAIFLFVSNMGAKIPDEIRSRCCKAKFSRVSSEVILGLLANIAHTNGVTTDNDALKAISRVSKGIVRDAVQLLNTVASMGDVTKDLVMSVVDLSLEDYSLKILSALAKQDAVEAAKIADEACRNTLPTKLLEALFAGYARMIYPQEDDPFTKFYPPIREALPDMTGMTTIFLRWSNAPHLPADVMPILLAELNKVHAQPERATGVAWRGPKALPGQQPEPEPSKKSAREVMKFLGGIEKT
jgi:DNA polymerase-3 subunit gamma/tau